MFVKQINLWSFLRIKSKNLFISKPQAVIVLLIVLLVHTSFMSKLNTYFSWTGCRVFNTLLFLLSNFPSTIFVGQDHFLQLLLSLTSQLDMCAGSVIFPINMCPPLRHDHSQDHNVGKSKFSNWVFYLIPMFPKNCSDSSSLVFSHKDYLFPTKNNSVGIMPGMAWILYMSLGHLAVLWIVNP